MTLITWIWTTIRIISVHITWQHTNSHQKYPQSKTTSIQTNDTCGIPNETFTIEFTNRSTSLTRTKKNLKLYIAQLWVHVKFSWVHKEKVTPKNITITLSHKRICIYAVLQYSQIPFYNIICTIRTHAHKKPGCRNHYVRPVIES